MISPFCFLVECCSLVGMGSGNLCYLVISSAVLKLSCLFYPLDIVVDNCAICRSHIMDLCIECQENQASQISQECTVAWGVCNVSSNTIFHVNILEAS